MMYLTQANDLDHAATLTQAMTKKPACQWQASIIHFLPKLRKIRGSRLYICQGRRYQPR